MTPESCRRSAHDANRHRADLGRDLWRGVVDDGFNADGSRRQRYVHAKTRDECVKKLRKLMQELGEHGRPLDHRTRVADLAPMWLADAGGRLKPKTMQGYRSQVTTSIIPILGKRVVSDLKPSDVRRLNAAVFARGVGPSSVAAAHRTLSAMLGYAVDEGYSFEMLPNPWISRRRPRLRATR